MDLVEAQRTLHFCVVYTVLVALRMGESTVHLRNAMDHNNGQHGDAFKSRQSACH